MQPQYQYFPLRNNASKKQYACLQENPVVLLWSFYRNGKPFLFRVGGSTSTLATLKVFSKFALQFLYNRYFYTDPTKLIELPIYGRLCLKIRRGYKVFDFQRQVVVKLFAKNIGSDIVQQEIHQARLVGKYDFAPAFLRENAAERWYEEEFVNGQPLDRSSWKSFLNTFREVLAPLIEQMTLISQPKEVMAGDYTRDIPERAIKKSLIWSQNELDSRKVNTIRGFVDSIIRKLHDGENHIIYLTFTHGDFGPRHVLVKKDRSVILDWEGAGIRSALYDLFDTFFERLRNKPFIPEVLPEVNKAIIQLQRRLLQLPNLEFSQVAASLSHVSTYRFVFYLERVSSVLQGEHKLSNQRLDKILVIIQTFLQYENLTCTHASKEKMPPTSFLDHGY